jgi:hypothetical protein
MTSDYGIVFLYLIFFAVFVYLLHVLYSYHRKAIEAFIAAHVGPVIISAAILVSVVVHSFANRYSYVHYQGRIQIIDRFTGRVSFPKHD